jgi:sortase, SrtB family
MSCIRTGGKDWRRSYKGFFNGKEGLKAKITVIFVAVTLAVVLLVICAYIILPSVISDANRQIEEHNLAQELYDMTVEQDIAAPTPSAAAAFVQPEPDPAGTLRFPRDGFSAALQQNPDIVGRITLDACDIAYLVTQADDNKTYLSIGYDRKKSRSGAIFLDYRCDIERSPLYGHYILYGHNMKNGTMFHNLMEYKDEDFFDANRILRFDTLYEDCEWEIFSAYVTGTDFYYIQTSFADDAEWLSFLNTIQQKSMFDTGVRLSADDVVLTLSTCTYEFDDARFVIHARLIG